jgi:asparagine synthase (glutamine-hydrolysing)
MCGIYGQYRPSGSDLSLIERMALSLAHRGPDGYGLYQCGPLAFGSGRLAIIDLDAGPQPLFSENHQIAVIFNGEIYNYKALHAELERAGHVFTTCTDTEVIVHGYEQWGDNVLLHLRGMFALGIWDEPRERLLLARDRLGEKPLYYASMSEGEFIFASEAKALFEHPGLRPAVNAEMLSHFLVLGYAPPPHTMFAGVEKLAPGERMIVDRHSRRKDVYWQAQMDASTAPDYGEAVRQVRQMLEQVVEMQMMSDVPVGAFLSGGVDSTAIVALMSRIARQPIQTFTVGFDFEPGSKNDLKFNVDARFAAQVAQQIGTQHHVINIHPDEGLGELLTHLVYAMDEPIANPTMVQTAYVAALARKTGVPVLLTGEAGDELFLGYEHYQRDQIVARYQRIPALLRKTMLDPLFQHLPARFNSLRKVSHKANQTDPTAHYLEWLRLIEVERMPDLLRDRALADGAFSAIARTLTPYLNAPNSRHFADRIAYTGLRLPLAEHYGTMRVDKMTMAMSVEARSPMLDYQFVEMAQRLPLEYKLRNGDTKRVFKDAVRDIVPGEVLRRPKWGFTPPASDWLRTSLRPLVEKVLTPDRVEAVGFFKPETVSSLIHAHIVDRKYEMWTVWTALVFHLWHGLYIDHSIKLDHKLSPADLYGSALVG